MIKAVIFDLDGTLLNRKESLENFINEQYERLHHLFSSIPKDKFISRFLELDNNGYVWKDKVYEQLITEFNLSQVSWEMLLQDYLEQFKYHCVGFPHIVDMLEDLKNNNIALGMITNGFTRFQLDNIEALGIEKYFQVILVSEAEGMKKPNPEIFLKALSKLEVKPSESIYIGDHPKNDVEAAQTIGMKAIWKKNEEFSMKEADAIIENYLELPLIIKNLN